MTRGSYSRRGIEQGKRPKAAPPAEPFRAIHGAANEFFQARGISPNAGTWASLKDAQGNVPAIRHREAVPEGSALPPPRKLWLRVRCSGPDPYPQELTKMQQLRAIAMDARRRRLIWEGDGD